MWNEARYQHMQYLQARYQNGPWVVDTINRLARLESCCGAVKQTGLQITGHLRGSLSRQGACDVGLPHRIHTMLQWLLSLFDVSDVWCVRSLLTCFDPTGEVFLRDVRVTNVRWRQISRHVQVDIDADCSVFCSKQAAGSTMAVVRLHNGGIYTEHCLILGGHLDSVKQAFHVELNLSDGSRHNAGKF